jgi:hypothetical protein
MGNVYDHVHVGTCVNEHILVHFLLLSYFWFCLVPQCCDHWTRERWKGELDVDLFEIAQFFLPPFSLWLIS